MSTSLKDALDDLATPAATSIASADLGRAAWLRGRRRRRRTWLVTAAVTVAAVAVIGVSLPLVVGGRSVLVNAAESDGTSVTSYPRRLGHQWWVSDLPDRSGPLAALVAIGGTGGGSVSWFAVSAVGHRWRIPVAAPELWYPTLSPNGRFLGYLKNADGPYVIHDLVSGRLTTFSTINGDGHRRDALYTVAIKSPAFWSRDNQSVIISASNIAHPGGAAVRLGVDGSVTAFPNTRTVPVGWLGNDVVAWLDAAGSTDGSHPASTVATLTDAMGKPIRSVAVRLNPTVDGVSLLPWTGVLSPDGTDMAILDSSANPVLHRVSLLDGAEHLPAVLLPYSLPPDNPVSCGMTWAGPDPAVPVRSESGNATTAIVQDGHTVPLLSVEPGLGTRCFVWATDALQGQERSAPAGLTDSWWTWWWRELLLGAVILILTSVGAWRICQASRRGRVLL